MSCLDSNLHTLNYLAASLKLAISGTLPHKLEIQALSGALPPDGVHRITPSAETTSQSPESE